MARPRSRIRRTDRGPICDPGPMTTSAPMRHLTTAQKPTAGRRLPVLGRPLTAEQERALARILGGQEGSVEVASFSSSI